MAIEGTLCLAIVATGILCASSFAQTPPPPAEHVPLQKTIGEVGPEIIPSLIVISFRGASLEAGKLTLTGVALNPIVFADRPVRAAGHTPLTTLLEEWAQKLKFLRSDPPNDWSMGL